MNASDVARYLGEQPDFFELYPELLGQLSIRHPQSGQAISLVERQSLLLRDRVRAMEARLAELVRNGERNDAIAEKLVRWSCAVLAQKEDAALPATVVGELQTVFDVPHGAIRLWSVQARFAALPFAAAVSEDVIRLATSMAAPFCGSNVGFEVAGWMNDDSSNVGAKIQSLAMLPLRDESAAEPFGLLVLGSPDKDRFQITMGTAFLTRIAAIASASLARLRA